MAMTLALDARALWMHRSMSTTGYELPPDESVIPWLPSTWSEEDEMDEYTVVEDTETVNVDEGIKTSGEMGEEVADGVPETTTDNSKSKIDAANPKETQDVVDTQDVNANEKETPKVANISDADSDSSAQTNLRGTSVALR